MRAVVRIVGRILLVLLLVVVAFAGFLVLSVPVDAWRTRGQIERVTNTVIPASSEAGSVDVRAWVARPVEGIPAGERRPAVIMIHEFWGMRDEIAGKAEALANEEGYVVVAPDTYRGQVTGWIPRAIWLTLSTQDERVHADLDTIYAWLQAQPDVDPEKIVVMGFCYGGGKALSYSLTNAGLAGTGVFYGSLISDAARLAALPGPVLGIFGETDTRPSPADVAAFEAGLQEAGIEHQLTIYPGVGHAFVQSIEAVRSDPTQGAAWAEFTAWLEAVTN